MEAKIATMGTLAECGGDTAPAGWALLSRQGNHREEAAAQVRPRPKTPRAICGLLVWSLAMLAGPASAADKYEGPRPAKPDVLYLMHADRLLETEVAEAAQSRVKDKTVYSLSGAGSPARTPLAEPVFLVQVEKLAPAKLQLFPFQVSGGQRQIEFNERKPKDNPRPLHFSITPLDKDLYRLEAQETLEIGQYAFSPSGSNQVFAFEVF